MKSRTTRRFRKAFEKLPPHVQQEAREAYELFLLDAHHPGLRFKQVHATRPIYSVRISRTHRALGVRDRDVMIWFWIGSHDDYDDLIKRA